ncbi:MAG: hypothetical protein MN733_06745 [Nitrososphaera sp.]|nr:hypothetical protein [Nitrososphaera sp.]
MKVISSRDVHAKSVTLLGLDSKGQDLLSEEAIAAALRRAAGFLCPCSPGTLIRAILQPLDGLLDEGNEIREAVEDILEALLAYGDLSEQEEESDQLATRRRLIYASPPSFLMRSSGAALLMGVTPDNVAPLPEHLQKQIEYINHIRILRAQNETDHRSYLAQFGLMELVSSSWMRAPKLETAEEYVRRLNHQLSVASRSGEIAGLSLIDPSRPTTYYRERWVESSTQTGRFVARRSQAYGADLWCYVELDHGQPHKLVDLPLPSNILRGCDEAWRLQAAIDALQGEPQRFRLRDNPSGTTTIEWFSPIPGWAHRRFDALAQPASRKGCLFAYEFRRSELEEELRFIREALWLAPLKS